VGWFLRFPLNFHPENQFIFTRKACSLSSIVCNFMLNFLSDLRYCTAANWDITTTTTNGRRVGLRVELGDRRVKRTSLWARSKLKLGRWESNAVMVPGDNLSWLNPLQRSAIDLFVYHVLGFDYPSHGRCGI
jgi:hypothetical protein